jgi:flagella basal body P-ring formation protein FlgA
MRTLLTFFLLLSISLPLPVLAGVAEQSIDQKEIRQALDDYLAAESERLPRVELRFSSVDLPDAFKVPQGHVEYQVVPAKPGVIGSRRVTLLTRVDDRLVGNQSIRVELEAMAEVMVAMANLRRGDTLDETNTVLQQQDISGLRQPIFTPEDVYGKQLKQSLRLGQTLDLKQVDFPPLIKRGDRVEIHVQRGSMILTAVGEARQDGYSGDTIRVKNSESHREILCRVVAPGLVHVEF